LDTFARSGRGNDSNSLKISAALMLPLFQNFTRNASAALREMGRKFLGFLFAPLLGCWSCLMPSHESDKMQP
jgi:hypothetical protein